MGDEEDLFVDSFAIPLPNFGNLDDILAELLVFYYYHYYFL